MRHIAQLRLLQSSVMKTTEMEKPVLVDECKCSSLVQVSSWYPSLQQDQPLAGREIVLSAHKKHYPVAAAQHHDLLTVLGPYRPVQVAFSSQGLKAGGRLRSLFPEESETWPKGDDSG